MRTFQLTVEVHNEKCGNFYSKNSCGMDRCSKKKTACCFGCSYFEECTDKRCDFFEEATIPYIITSLKEVEK